MKLGLISDSHDHIVHIAQAARIFREKGVDRVLHAGDIVSPPALRILEGLTLYAVCGNNDGEQIGLLKTVEKMGGTLATELLEMELPNGRAAVYHGTVPALLEALICSQTYDLVVYGHTHKIVDRQEGKTRVLNPGTAHGFGNTATIMIYDTHSTKTELITLT
ncbi:metallophosphoesterase family protein [Candidatus Magnetaquicoccus inordinatus]|uniref:metallophosphoesterase family protein n=1 Tax=Candidatus Magnetaquicoccus inordinatus TaxID=2496818 RepID=UPI00187D640F|nr:YfcE family phosphodiesterase [Candidatus Magnetaquicoccus inordinatus]